MIPVFCGDGRATPDLINLKDGMGRTPLMLAVSSGSLACIYRLDEIETVEWITINALGESLFAVARRMGNPEVLNYFEEKRRRGGSLSVLAVDRSGEAVQGRGEGATQDRGVEVMEGRSGEQTQARGEEAVQVEDTMNRLDSILVVNDRREAGYQTRRAEQAAQELDSLLGQTRDPAGVLQDPVLRNADAMARFRRVLRQRQDYYSDRRPRETEGEREVWSDQTQRRLDRRRSGARERRLERRREDAREIGVRLERRTQRLRQSLEQVEREIERRDRVNRGRNEVQQQSLERRWRELNQNGYVGPQNEVITLDDTEEIIDLEDDQRGSESGTETAGGAQLRPGTEEEFEAARQAEAGLNELQRKLIRECPVCTHLMVAPIRIYRCK